MSEPTSLYRHWDASGALLYVGISLQPFKRLDQHGEQSHWFRDIASVTVSYFENRSAALAAEKEAIKTEKPRHNIIHAERDASKTERRRRRGSRTLRIEDISESIMSCMYETSMGRCVYFKDVHAGRSLGDFMANFEIIDEYEGTQTDDGQVADALLLLELRGQLRRIGERWFLPALGHYLLVANDNIAAGHQESTA